MEQVYLKPLHHRGQESIGIYYTHSVSLNTIIKKLPNVKWSQTNKCWYIPLKKENYSQLSNALSGKAAVETMQLKEYLTKKKKINSTLTHPLKKNTTKFPLTSPVWKLTKENLTALEKYIEQLKLKVYSPSTIRTYRNEFMQLLQILKKKSVNDLTTDDLRRYMVYAIEKEGIKENTAHSRLNALKFYFEQVLKKEKFFWEIPRSKKRFIRQKCLEKVS